MVLASSVSWSNDAGYLPHVCVLSAVYLAGHPWDIVDAAKAISLITLGIHSFVRPFVRSALPLFVRLFFRSFVRSFARSLIQASIHSLTHARIHRAIARLPNSHGTRVKNTNRPKVAPLLCM